jgi:ABC-type multidrug transport system fused ATPase/permease subunit
MGGLLKPTAGQILINGKPVEEIRSSLAETIAYVGPEPYLLPGTVRENLLYPKTKAVIDDQILWQALRDSHIDHVIEGFPKGLDHLLFEDTQLSTGQKQRLALARALIRQPGLLILDEATANIDVETEGKIIQTLIKKKASMLITVVSHRSTFDAIADQVMSL